MPRLLKTLIALGASLALSQSSHADIRPKVLWYQTNMPPHYIENQGDERPGVNQQVLKVLTDQLGQYQHEVRIANSSRTLKALEQLRNVCSVGLVKNPQLEKHTLFSEPWGILLSHGAIYRSQDQQLLAPYLTGDGLDLEALLKQQALIAAIAKKRNYGTDINSFLNQLPEHQLHRFSGSNEFQSLLRILKRHHDADIIFGYPTELNYFVQQQNLALSEVSFINIKGAPATDLAYIGCTRSEQGKAIIEQVNQLIVRHRGQLFAGFYQSWLPAEKRRLHQQFIEQHWQQ